MIPCYNEEGNLEPLYEAILRNTEPLTHYEFEFIFIDNASTDKTVAVLRNLAERDKRVRIICNLRNFGHIRSPYYGLLQTHGDATIGMACDLQDPPELIPEFLKRWESGEKLVVGVKTRSDEPLIIYSMRTLYYKLLNATANVELIEHFTGFGLYDRSILNELAKLQDPYPYLRGLISELGFKASKVEFTQPTRKHGKSKSSFYALYDLAMLGLTSHTIVPMRFATIAGFTLAGVCLLVSLAYAIYKFIFWNSFSVGMAPLVIGMFFLFSVQLAFIGLMGEYLGMVLTHVMNRPLVIEKERINFPEDRVQHTDEKDLAD